MRKKIKEKGSIIGYDMEENGELIAVKANKFVQEYKVSLSLTEIRIVNYLISNIDSPKYDKEFRKFRFEIKEFCNIVYPNKKIGDAYNWLPKILEDLAHKGAWKEVPSTENPGKMKKALIHWIERPEFEVGYITIELNPNLAPYLLQLDKSFIKSKFQYTALAQSKYTIPLYELLKSWEKVYKKKFEIDELRAYMDAMDKTYSNTAAFKRRVLDPAIKEINEITDLQVSYTEIKRGRKTTNIEFVILPKEKKSEVYEKRENVSDEVDSEFIRKYYGILMEQYPEFNEKEIYNLFQASVKHLDLIGAKADEKQYEVAAFIRPKLNKIYATPEETKTTVFYRLLNAVENDY